ncbi:hypothetical protein L596_017624 [Steinernema carpocapsae]|uniref:Uncharacterized protein n=1 Tax=Steinernema carpocapsae TaxID=34508 RepID=A0A4U5N2J2_STECR|nr:hypothetical protein L596_017624 [Steinernema carpocapsae]
MSEYQPNTKSRRIFRDRTNPLDGNNNTYRIPVPIPLSTARFFKTFGEIGRRSGVPNGKKLCSTCRPATQLDAASGRDRVCGSQHQKSK